MSSPFSRPAGHRQSVWEQEPRAERARARPLARRRPGAGLRAAGREAAGRTRAATASAGGSGPEQKESGGGCSRWNGGRILAQRASPPLPLAAAPNAESGQSEGGGPRTLTPGPGSRWSSDFCNCWHFGGLVLFLTGSPSLLSTLNTNLPSALRTRASTHSRRGAARSALRNMRRLGTCLATLAGLLLTAAGETFSGKQGHFCRRLGRQQLLEWESQRLAVHPGRGPCAPGTAPAGYSRRRARGGWVGRERRTPAGAD